MQIDIIIRFIIVLLIRVYDVQYTPPLFPMSIERIENCTSFILLSQFSILSIDIGGGVGV